MSNKKNLLDDSGEEEEADEQYFTPPEYRRLFTWDNIHGLTNLDSSQDQEQKSPERWTPRETEGSPVRHRRSTIEGYGGASTSGTQQREPSVRPKVRQPQRRERADSAIPEDYPSSIGQRYGGASTSSSSLQQQVEPSVRPKVRTGPPPPSTPPRSRPPIPKHVRTPTPPNVEELRDPRSHRPDWQLMRYRSMPVPFHTPEARGYELATRSRREMNRIYKWPHTKTSRKHSLLERRNYDYDKESERYISSSDDGSDVSEYSERRNLIPSRERDESELFNPRFYRPLDTMGDRTRSEIMPVGSLGFGRLDPDHRRRWRSLDELRVRGVKESPDEWNPREQAFALKLRSLSDDDLDAYKDYRKLVDPRFQKFARRRMRPAPTGANLTDYNKKFLTRMKSDKLRAGTLSQRRDSVRSRASLPSALSKEAILLPTIEESDSDSDGDGGQYDEDQDKKKKKKKKKKKIKDKCLIQ